VRIIGVETQKEIRGAKKTKNSAAGGFSGFINGGAEIEESSAIAAPVAVSGLWNLQMIEEKNTDDGLAKKEAEEVLGMLLKIQQGLLDGKVSLGELEKISALVSRWGHYKTEPGLKKILADVELRVQVELAKLGQV
jgi:hypothetical protein